MGKGTSTQKAGGGGGAGGSASKQSKQSETHQPSYYNDHRSEFSQLSVNDKSDIMDNAAPGSRIDYQFYEGGGKYTQDYARKLSNGDWQGYSKENGKFVKSEVDDSSVVASWMSYGAKITKINLKNK